MDIPLNVAGPTLCHRHTIEIPSPTDHDRTMKRAARLPLTFALGLMPFMGAADGVGEGRDDGAEQGDPDSRNMAAQIDSDEARRERTLYRSAGSTPPSTRPVA